MVAPYKKKYLIASPGYNALVVARFQANNWSGAESTAWQETA